MKKMKKLLSMLVAATMTLAMAAPSFADTPQESTSTYKITINSENSGHTYEAYQIFAGDLALRDGKKVLSNIIWGSGINDEGKAEFGEAAEKAEEITDNGKAATFAQEVGAYLSAVNKTSTPIIKKDETTGENKITGYEITNLEPGYYLVKDAEDSLDGSSAEAYTRFILEVVGDATATPKSSDNDIPKFDKTVGNDNKKGDDYSIGDDVPFQLKATMPETYADYTAYKLVFEDELTSGLTFNQDSVKLFVGNTEIDNYSTIEGVGVVFNGQKMVFTITDAKEIASIAANSEVIVKYTAKLNDKATAGTTDKNKATLEYSNNPNNNGEGTGKTVDKEVKVYTFKLALTKVASYADGTAEENKVKLENAEFTLQKADGKFATVADGKITGWVDSNGTTLTSDVNGLINVDGLDAGTYTLTETKAPAGYNKLADPIILTITSFIGDDGTLTALTASYTADGKTDVHSTGAVMGTGVVSLEVTNNSGAQLPSTGGIGTTIFYAVGIILMAGAVFFVVRRKRA